MTHVPLSISLEYAPFQGCFVAVKSILSLVTLKFFFLSGAAMNSYNFFKTSLYLSVCLCMCVPHVWEYPQKPEDGVRFAGLELQGL